MAASQQDLEMATKKSSDEASKSPPPPVTTLVSKEERGTWNNEWDFLFSCISVSVGLGNVWRFPYLAYKNGGGTFLVIYFLTMIFCGIPIFILEVSIGQFLGEGGMTIVGRLCPMLKGVGIATMIMVIYYNAYYCVIVAWSLYYFVISFTAIPDVPWNTCSRWWNTEKCFSPFDGSHQYGGLNATVAPVGSVSPAEDFWNNRVLGMNAGLEYGLGDLQWHLVASIVGAWVLVYLIVWRGLHQSGYVIWFTALFPYFVMATLLVRAVTLPGSWNGLMAYLTVDYYQFMDSTTWIDAATQIFFAYSVGTGALPALGSYNKFNHDCLRDALITCIVNTCTCCTAGALVFSILGHMAYVLDTPIHEVVNSGPGLVFVTYPELVLSLPFAFFWAGIFFAMMLVLGIDTEFCSVESLITGLVDNWPQTLLPRRRLVVVVTCCLLFLGGLPMLTEGGVYLFQLVDFYAASGLSLLWICFFETIAVSWIYGAERFANDIQRMVGRRPFWLWVVCWKFFAPVVMACIFLYYVLTYRAVMFGDFYKYPKWAEILGLCISLSSMIWVPAYAIYYLAAKAKGSIMERFRQGLSPVDDLAERIAAAEAHAEQTNA